MGKFSFLYLHYSIVSFLHLHYSIVSFLYPHYSVVSFLDPHYSVVSFLDPSWLSVVATYMQEHCSLKAGEIEACKQS